LSEHTFNGKRYDGEFHLVHKSKETNEIMVIGIPIVIDNSGNDYDQGGKYYDRREEENEEDKEEESQEEEQENENEEDEEEDEEDNENEEDEEEDEEENENDEDDEEEGEYHDISNTIEPLIEIYEMIGNNVQSACNSGTAVSTTYDESPNHLSHNVANLEEDWDIYDILPNGEEEGQGQEDKRGVGVYAYTGSLTTPPCTTGVQWYVLDRPSTIYKSQWSRLSTVIGGWSAPSWPACSYNPISYGDSIGTFRPTQEVGRRNVYHFCTI